MPPGYETKDENGVPHYLRVDKPVYGMPQAGTFIHEDFEMNTRLLPATLPLNELASGIIPERTWASGRSVRPSARRSWRVALDVAAIGALVWHRPVQARRRQ